MLLDNRLLLDKSPPATFWIVVFTISFVAMFYLGLSPELIKDWYLVLVGFNVVMSIVALYFIVINMRRLKQDTAKNVIGAKFTWSFVRIIPVLVLFPLLSFYIFSFSSVRDNLNTSQEQFDNFNITVAGEVDQLYKHTNDVTIKYYLDKTMNITKIVDYVDLPQMQTLLDRLVSDDWACAIKIYDENMILLASSTASKDNCLEEGYTASSDNFTLISHYAEDPTIANLNKKMISFRNAAKQANLELNSTIIETHFMLDFSSAVLLAILTALLVVLRMIDQLMRPMHNLSLATREISMGNYDVEIKNDTKNTDLHELIVSFNEMSKRIKLYREGLDTHNLYLEAILKYSFGVIALNLDKTIKIINPVIGRMLQIDEEKVFIGQSYDSIINTYDYLKPLFAYVENNINKGQKEWASEIELILPDRYLLLYCQGASLDVKGNTLGYVIMVNDISKLNRAQKKAAWGEVAMRMAHEIKNPLTPILLSAQRLRNLFLDKLQGKDSAIIDKTTSTIIDQVESMNAMVSAFTNYANIPEIQRIPSSLNALINKTISLYDAQDGVRIDLDLSGDLPELYLDDDSMSRVLINLIKNSTEASQRKEQLNILISTRLKVDGNIVVMKVIDDGDGFPDNIIEQVFDPYITTKGKGSGLGLAIVQNIIEQHEAQIYASNIKPHGARILIEFSIIDGKRSLNG